jgi:hypothetical protein
LLRSRLTGARFNTNGVASLSPGLRGTSYLGHLRYRFINPERVAALGHMRTAGRFDTTPSGL